MDNFVNIFQSLISHKESEVVEFKKAENNFDFDDLGKYFSALSNEANLRGLDFAWLIFGYDEKKHKIVGTSYKNGESALNNLKHDFAQHTTDGQTFREIVPIDIDGKRILMFKIPASPRNIVMKWKGIAFGRDGESLKPLNQSKMDEIRHQTPEPDWSEVAVRIYGNAINERYTKLLKDNDTLTLHDCISLDAIQKGHRIDEEIAQDLMKRGLIEGEAPNYTISLGVAKASKQLPGYTRVRGLERDKLKQMILQYIQNAGSDGAKRDAILEYLQGTLPSRNTYEQNETLIYHLLSELRKAGLIEANGKIWLAKNTQ